MKIVYIGNNMYGRFAFRKIAEEMSADFYDFVEERISENFEGSIEIRNITDELLDENADFYVVDLDLFSDKEKTIVEEVYKLKEAINCKIIVHAPFYEEKSRILKDLRALGINDIITTAENQGEITSFFKESVTGNETVSEDEQEALIQDREQSIEELISELPQIGNIEGESEEPVVINKYSNVMKIAVVGSKRGIGTTTAALQLVKYLNRIEEASAAYIEMNDTEYVDNLQEYFDCDKYDAEMSMCKIGGTSLFSDSRKLSQILSEGYKFCIYDYGALHDVHEKSSIYEKDMIILVGGIKANEIQATTNAIEELYTQQNVFYIMNFVSSRSRDLVRDFMESKSDMTYFLEESPDPFVLSADNNKIFSDILKKHQQPHISFKNRKIRRIFK